MPLVRGGHIVTDPLIHLADDADIPGDGAILISAKRFLEDGETLSAYTIEKDELKQTDLV